MNSTAILQTRKSIRKQAGQKTDINMRSHKSSFNRILPLWSVTNLSPIKMYEINLNNLIRFMRPVNRPKKMTVPIISH